MNGAWDADAVDSTASAEPAALAGLSLFIDPEIDNAYYDGLIDGTRAELLAAIADPSSWIGDASEGTLGPTRFVVRGDAALVPVPATLALAASAVLMLAGSRRYSASRRR